MAISHPKDNAEGGRYRECIAAIENDMRRLIEEALQAGWTKGEICMAVVHCSSNHAELTSAWDSALAGTTGRLN